MSEPPDSEGIASLDLARYARQMRYAPIGEAGQRKLAQSRALVCGCGALGSVIAETLARSGVGHIRIVDRDFLELNNLQRQVLYDEDDVAAGLPKVVAAAAKLRKINSHVTIDAIVADVNHANVLSFVEGVGTIVDGTDNFETRFLLNDVSLKLGIPWIYGGCLGAEGQSMTILPGETACLRCLMQDMPPPGATPTCDTAGILAPIVNVIASLEAAEALKILSGNRQATSRVLSVIDLWDNRLRQMNLASLRKSGGCPACARREFPWLDGQRSADTAILCGRNAVQIRPAQATGEGISLDTLAAKLAGVGKVARNRHLLRLAVDEYQMTIFPDGRAIIAGTDDIATARTLYARYVGS